MLQHLMSKCNRHLFGGLVSCQENSLVPIYHPRIQRQQFSLGRVSDEPEKDLREVAETVAPALIFKGHPDTNLLLTKLFVLRKHGCHLHQLMEYPDILKLDDTKIDERAVLLKELGYQVISVPMLSYAVGKNENKVKRFVDRYLERKLGHLSTADFLIHKLSCSEEKMVEVILKYPRLVTSGGVNHLQSKIDLLLEHGATKEEIVENPRVLTQHGLTVLKKLISEAQDHRFLHSLPVRALSQQVKTFREFLKKHDEKSDLKERADLLGFHPDMIGIKASQVTSGMLTKWKYLTCSHKYTKDDIRDCAYIFHRGRFSKLKQAMEELTAMGFEKPSLRLVASFMASGLVRNSKEKRESLDSLFPSGTQVTKMDTNEFKIFFLQSQSKMENNLNFLKNQGFHDADIAKFPVVLGHDSSILELKWGQVCPKAGISSLDTSEKEILLNMLQYFIEKDMNFGCPVAIDKIGMVPGENKMVDGGHPVLDAEGDTVSRITGSLARNSTDISTFHAEQI